MNAYTISLIFTGLAALIIALSVLFGVIRGAKKSAFRLCWLFATFIIVFLITPSISNMLNTIDISSLNLNIYGTVNRVCDIGVNLLNEFAKNEPTIQNSGAVQSLAENLPIILLNLIVFVLLFWILKWILWPIWAAFSSHFFDKEKREEKMMKKQRKEQLKHNPGFVNKEQNDPLVFIFHKKKKRFVGALLGFITGVLLCIITFCPIVGINSIYQNAYANLQIKKDGETVSLIDSSVEDKQVLEYVSSYENSIINKIFNYSGVNLLSKSLFNNLATVKIADKKVNLSDEINVAINVYNHIDTISNFNIDNLTQKSIDNAITAVKEVFIDIDDSAIIYLIGDDVLPHYIGKLISSENFKLIDGAKFDELIVTAYQDYSRQIGLEDLKQQAEALFDVIMNLNNYNLIAPIVNKEIKSFDNFTKFLNNNLKNHSDFTNDIIDNLYNIDMLKNKYPDLFNQGIKSLFNTLNIYYEEQSIDGLIMKDDFKKILTNALNFIRYYAESTNYDFGNDTVYAFSSVGKVVDIIKDDFLSEKNYNSLISYCLGVISDTSSKFTDFSSLLNGAKNVNCWKDELNAIAGTYKAIIQIINDKITVDKLMDKNYDKLENVGLSLDGAIRGNSVILTNENIRKYLEIVLDNLKTFQFDNILNVQVEDGVSLKQRFLNNIYDENSEINPTKITEWQNEIIYNLNLIRNIYPVVKSKFDVQSLSSKDNTQLVEIGKELDIVVKNTNILLTNNIIKTIINYFLTEEITLPYEITEILNSQGLNGTIYEDILNNISDSNTDLVWESELNKFKGLLAIDFTDENFNFINIGENLDEIRESQIITKEIITSIITNYVGKQTEAWKSDETLSAVRDNLLANLYKIESYALEFDYIGKVLTVMLEEDKESSEFLSILGSTFNEVRGFTGKTASNILTKDLLECILTSFISSSIEGVDENIKGVFTDLQSNFDDITDYQVELSYIYNLILCLSNKYDANQDSVCDLKDLGKVLDIAINNEDASKVSNVITKYIVQDLMSYFVEINSKDITEQDLKDIIDELNTNIQNDDVVISSYESEFYFLTSLFEVINNTDFSTVGTLLDNVRGNSSLITEDIISDFVLYFYKQSTSSYTDEDYEDIISGIESKVESIKDDASKSYKQALEELEEIVSIINELSSINSLEDFANAEVIGANLDNMEDCVVVCDKNITYMVASLVVGNILNSLQSLPTYKQDVENVLNSDTFSFYTYNTSSNSYNGNYYTDLMVAIKNVLPIA